MTPMRAKERLYLTGDKTRLVRHGDPKAAFLYAAEGDDIPDTAAKKFGLVDGLLKKSAPANRNDTLLGSSVLPAHVVISDTKTVQLGDVVAAAHRASRLSVDAWNDLPATDREARLAKTIEGMRAQAIAPPKATKPRAAKPKAEKAPPASKEEKPAENKEAEGGENKSG